MKFYFAALVGAAVVQKACSHNTQGILLVNGTETAEWKFVRDVAWMWEDKYSPPGHDYPKLEPIVDIDNPNITCGRNAFESASKTDTADVLAGSEVGFRVSWDGTGKYGVFWHPGPAQIYLSRAPDDDIERYTGNGNWFKIAYAGPKNDRKWQLQSASDVRFWTFQLHVPRTTPPGKYLLRIEQFMPTDIFGYSQWYINCAHVNIIGPGGGNPTSFAQFPGTYKIEDPGLWVPLNQLVNGGYVKDEDMRLMEYKPPGPPV